MINSLKSFIFIVAGILFLILNISCTPVTNSKKDSFLNLFDKNEDGFVVIAHRGASAYAPENTMSAIRLAVEQQAEMVEIDVVLSKEGIPVVIHEDSLSRTTDGEGFVSSFSVEELQEFDAGSWFSEDFVGEKIPTLEEVLAYCKDKIAVNIEIKTEAVRNDDQDGVEKFSLDLVNQLEMRDQVIFSSFDYRALKRLKTLDSEIPVAMLYERRQSGDKSPVQLVEEYKLDGFNSRYSQLSQEWADLLNEAEIPFSLYTINEEEMMKKFIGMGASAIFSDKPDLLKQVIEDLSK